VEGYGCKVGYLVLFPFLNCLYGVFGNGVCEGSKCSSRTDDAGACSDDGDGHRKWVHLKLERVSQAVKAVINNLPLRQ
jgi:hypothetical protein